MNKTCSKCKETKSINEFYVSRCEKDGRQRRCKECDKGNYLKNKKLPENIKDRFMYQAVISESELEKVSYLTYGEILELFRSVLVYEDVE